MLDRQHGFRFRPLSYTVIERFAVRARSALLPGMPYVDPVPGLRLFEDLSELEIGLGDRVIRVNYAVNELPTSIEGMSTFDADRDEILVTLDPNTYAGLIHKVPRALFCLCHELGHVCMHTLKLLELSSIPHEVAALNRGNIPAHRIFEDTEWQANAFAAAFLMPAIGLKQLETVLGVLTPQNLARRFNVSFDAGRIRLDLFGTRRRELLRAAEDLQANGTDTGRRD